MPINSGECFQFNNGSNELIKIYYNNTEIKNNIIIKYNLEIEEPEYNQYIKNLEIIDIYSDNITEEDSFEPRTFKDKTKKIIICIDPDCPEETELTENINIASSIITYPIKTTINNIPIVIPTYSQINKCSEEDILNNLCYENLDEKQLERICNIIREKIVNNNITYNTIIQTKNAVIQVATVNITKYQNNPNVSNLDLGECEEILKKEYGLTKDLLIFKLDIKFNNSSKIYVQYEVYDSDKKIKLDINKCKGHQITISLPAQLGSDIVSLYNDMSEYGYNLFNDSDSFYNDICTLYKSKNGTDILLTDRQDIYLNNEKNNYCQSNCDFVSYNSNTLKENCDCKIQEQNQIITDLNYLESNENEFLHEFYETLINSNFLVMKCYKLVFGEKGFKNNIGSIIMIVFFFILLILLFVFIFYSNNKIKKFICIVLDIKLNTSKKISFNKINTNKKYVRNTKGNNSLRDLQKKNKIIKDNYKSLKLKTNSLNEERNLVKPRNNQAPPKILATNNISILKSSHKKIHNTSENRKKNPVNILIQINNNNNYNYNLKSSVNNSTSKNQIMNDTGKKKIRKSEGIFIFDFEYSRKYLNVRLTNNTELNDQELNTLNYESALELDKRTFFQYYYGLIKRKQLIFFTFCTK